MQQISEPPPWEQEEQTFWIQVLQQPQIVPFWISVVQDLQKLVESKKKLKHVSILDEILLLYNIVIYEARLNDSDKSWKMMQKRAWYQNLRNRAPKQSLAYFINIFDGSLAKIVLDANWQDEVSHPDWYNPNVTADKIWQDIASEFKIDKTACPNILLELAFVLQRPEFYVHQEWSIVVCMCVVFASAFQGNAILQSDRGVVATRLAPLLRSLETKSMSLLARLKLRAILLFLQTEGFDSEAEIDLPFQEIVENKMSLEMKILSKLWWIWGTLLAQKPPDMKEILLIDWPLPVHSIKHLPSSFPRLILAKSTIPDAGEGVFAGQRILANTVVCLYEGYRVAYPDQTQEKYTMNLLCMPPDGKPNIVGLTPEGQLYLGTYVNHAKANLSPEELPQDPGYVFLKTTKDIEAGQELFLDYGKVYSKKGMKRPKHNESIIPKGYHALYSSSPGDLQNPVTDPFGAPIFVKPGKKTQFFYLGLDGKLKEIEKDNVIFFEGSIEWYQKCWDLRKRSPKAKK